MAFCLTYKPPKDPENYTSVVTEWRYWPSTTILICYFRYDKSPHLQRLLKESGPKLSMGTHMVRVEPLPTKCDPGLVSTF